MSGFFPHVLPMASVPEVFVAFRAFPELLVAASYALGDLFLCFSNRGADKKRIAFQASREYICFISSTMR